MTEDYSDLLLLVLRAFNVQVRQTFRHLFALFTIIIGFVRFLLTVFPGEVAGGVLR